MFKKSRRKIVITILAVMLLLLSGTFCVIYLASYVDMTNENRELLKEYAASYSLPGDQKESPASHDGSENNIKDEIPRITGAGQERGFPPDKPPKLELSTFYSVAVSDAGQTLKVDTADVSNLDEEALEKLAFEIMESGKCDGVRDNLIYRMEEKDGYILVAFLDNTLMMENVGTMITYTLIFGAIAMAVMFFPARYLADRIVAPLEESYTSQRQFISDAGHELKTPVAVMNANIELLSRQIGENQWLANIRYENERMSGLVIQLLELARAENVAPQTEPLDLSRLVFGETLPFETVAYEKGMTLSSEIAEEIWVSGNSIQLKQLVSILIDNAVRHSSRGDEVNIVLKKGKGHALLSVINDGEEIPPEQVQHLFERFYRRDEARTGEDGNYGLGLAIAKAIAEAHKGNIGVCCGGGKVEFTVRVPLVK